MYRLTEPELRILRIAMSFLTGCRVPITSRRVKMIVDNTFDYSNRQLHNLTKEAVDLIARMLGGLEQLKLRDLSILPGTDGAIELTSVKRPPEETLANFLRSLQPLVIFKPEDRVRIVYTDSDEWKSGDTYYFEGFVKRFDITRAAPWGIEIYRVEPLSGNARFLEKLLMNKVTFWKEEFLGTRDAEAETVELKDLGSE